MRLQLKLRTLEENNIFYLSVEVFFTAILAAAQSFFQLYAIRLGASNTEISLLTSIPSLFTIALSFPIGRFLQSSARPRRWIFGGLVMNRLTLGLLVLVPLVSLAGVTQGTLVIAVMI